MLPIYTLGLRIFLVNEKDYNCHNCPLQIYSPPLFLESAYSWLEPRGVSVLNIATDLCQCQGH